MTTAVDFKEYKFAITMTCYGNTILVTHPGYISKVTWDADGIAASTILTGAIQKGNKDDRFREARFYFSFSITALFTNTFFYLVNVAK